MCKHGFCGNFCTEQGHQPYAQVNPVYAHPIDSGTQQGEQGEAESQITLTKQWLPIQVLTGLAVA